MNSYELTFITISDAKTTLSAIEKYLTDLEGKVTEQKPWGKRTFAYPIKKLSEGFYHTWQFTLTPAVLIDFKKKMNTNEDVIRYLLLKK